MEIEAEIFRRLKDALRPDLNVLTAPPADKLSVRNTRPFCATLSPG
jgi:hypothetical protein